MELSLQEKLKLIKFFEFLLNEEISKPLGEMNSEAVDNYISILLHLQGKKAELSSEYIDEQVKIIFQKENKSAPLEAVKTQKKYFNKKKVCLIAACIAILVALLSIVGVAKDWNVFDFLNEKFGSVFSVPIEEEQDFNGITVVTHGRSTEYKTIQDALSAENIKILFPDTLPQNCKVNEIVIGQENNVDRLFISFDTPGVSIEISLDTQLNQENIDVCNKTMNINGIQYYLCIMEDVNQVQAHFTYDNNLYVINHYNENELVEILNSMEEIKNEN